MSHPVHSFNKRYYYGFRPIPYQTRSPPMSLRRWDLYYDPGKANMTEYEAAVAIIIAEVEVLNNCDFTNDSDREIAVRIDKVDNSIRSLTALKERMVHHRTTTIVTTEKAKAKIRALGFRHYDKLPEKILYNIGRVPLLALDQFVDQMVRLHDENGTGTDELMLWILSKAFESRREQDEPCRKVLLTALSDSKGGEDIASSIVKITKEENEWLKKLGLDDDEIIEIRKKCTEMYTTSPGSNI